MSYNNNNGLKRLDKVFVDDAIRAKMVLVIDGENGINQGIMPLASAIAEARNRGLNLVQMSASSKDLTPTCKILDYDKFRFDESKKFKLQQKKQRESQVEDKEITFRPDTALNDLQVKAKKAIDFLNNGDRVKVTIKCVGREATHPDVFRATFALFLKCIPNAQAVTLANEFRGKFSYLITRVEPRAESDKKIVNV